MGLKDIFVALLLTGLFFIAMVSFGHNLALDNNANETILNNSRISAAFGNTTIELFNSVDTANDSRTSFELDEIKTNSDNLIITSIKGVGTAVGGTISVMYNLIFGVLADVLGIPPLAFATITSIFSILIVFFAWRAYRAGS